MEFPEKCRKNAAVLHSFEFAVEVSAYCSELNRIKQFDLARQRFKSGTSIGANIWEAQEAESRADFIHKIKISAKEASETYFWLLLSQETIPLENTNLLLCKLTEIRKILSAIINSSKKS